jgi:alkaline phosphatase D
MRFHERLAPLLVLLVLAACAGVRQAAEPLRITHGIASGDVTASSAVIWARANRAATMTVEYLATAPAQSRPLHTRGLAVTAARDFTGHALLEGLRPDTRYAYRVRFVDGRGHALTSEAGRFRTAPAEGAARPLTLVWWGDLGGQGYCRDPERGYAIFTQMMKLDPDAAVANGDAIYADGTCPPVTDLADHPRNALSADPEVAAHQLTPATDPRWTTEAEVLAGFRAKWKYNLEDAALRAFRAHTPHYHQWDDHEVINDWFPGEERVGAMRATGDPRPIGALVAPARRAFFEYTPTRANAEGRIYRSIALGTLAELFLLDARSYRDDNILPDGPGRTLDVRLPSGEERHLTGKAKSILGAEQREWLLGSLAAAQARGVVWKIVSTDDPLSAPTGGYTLFTPARRPLYTVRDGWAAGPRLNTDSDGNQDNPLGFESELRVILAALKTGGITNVVWLATDVHYARLLRYEPGGELAGLVFHEFIAGPANAASGVPRPVSATFGPVELYARGQAAGRRSFFNFGLLRIAADGTLTVEIRDADGGNPRDDQGRPGVLSLTPVR